MIVYKWVKEHSEGLCSLYLIPQDAPFFMCYSTTEWTTAPAEFPSALPMAFYTEQEARAFRETGAMNGEQLWEAEATVAGLVRYVASSPSKISIEAIHLKQFQDVDRVRATDGTVMCNRIRLTRRLE